MHILKVIHGFPPVYNAGSEVYSQSLCHTLSDRHRVSVFTREENDYELDFSLRKEKRRKNLDLYLLNIPRGKDGYDHPQVNRQFGRLVEKIRPDAAHIGHLNHLSTGIVDELWRRRIPILFTLHDFWLMCPRGQFLQRNFDGQNLHRLCDGQENAKCAAHCYRMMHAGSKELEARDLAYWTDWIDKRMQATIALAGKVDLFHAPSMYLMNRFIQDFHIPAEKIFYMDYGFPIHRLHPPGLAKNRTEFTFGYIGTHIPAKGVHLLIQAFQRLRGKARLKIWGRSLGQSTSALRSLAQNCNNPVEFLGEYQNGNIVSDVFAQVDCIVVPSIWTENSPLVIHEAQACRIPVITADAGGMREYVAHEVNGRLFAHRDAESLGSQMQYAIDHPEEMVRLGERGYLHDPGGNAPDMISHAAQLENIYKHLVEMKKHGAPVMAYHDRHQS